MSRQRVGSYPKFDRGVDVSVIGKDNDRLDERRLLLLAFLLSCAERFCTVVEEICKELEGTKVAEGVQLRHA